MEKTKHTHKFKKIRYKSGNEVFFCTLPDCNVKINPVLALGKRCQCWRCGNDFILNEYALRLVKPHCEACHKPKNSQMVGSIPSNEVKSIPEIALLTLSERLQQTINQAQQTEEEEI